MSFIITEEPDTKQMVIRVATKDVESGKLLVAGLVGLFGGEYVSLQSDSEVHVQLNGQSGQRAMAETFAFVERWLEESGVGCTDVWVDDRQYRMEL
jgi:hypothetical protein